MEDKFMDTFDIKDLILRGKRAVREYEIPNIGTVLVRPLTDLEMSKGEIAMIDNIKDGKTRAYLLGKSSDVDNVDFNAIAEASVRSNIMIAFLAMKDFTEDKLLLEEVEQLPGVAGIANFVREISGAYISKEALEAASAEMKDFREV